MQACMSSADMPGGSSGWPVGCAAWAGAAGLTAGLESLAGCARAMEPATAARVAIAKRGLQVMRVSGSGCSCWPSGTDMVRGLYGSITQEPGEGKGKSGTGDGIRQTGYGKRDTGKAEQIETQSSRL